MGTQQCGQCSRCTLQRHLSPPSPQCQEASGSISERQLRQPFLYEEKTKEFFIISPGPAGLTLGSAVTARHVAATVNPITNGCFSVLVKVNYDEVNNGHAEPALEMAADFIHPADYHKTVSHQKGAHAKDLTQKLLCKLTNVRSVAGRPKESTTGYR